MRLRKWSSGVALGTVVLVALALGNSAGAQGTTTATQPTSVKLNLTESRNSGVSGTATLTDVEGGVRVALDVKGLPKAGVEHINHIHGGGTCAQDRAGQTAPITIPLTTITANDDGTGSASTLIRGASLAQLFDRSQQRFILLHAESVPGEGVPPGITCADFDPDLMRGGTTTGALAKTGGVAVWPSLGPTALLVGSALTLAFLWRRR